jgi:hypothetical protein
LKILMSISKPSLRDTGSPHQRVSQNPTLGFRGGVGLSIRVILGWFGFAAWLKTLAQSRLIFYDQPSIS